MKLDPFRPLIRAALSEDIGSGDVTTQISVPKKTQFNGRFVAKADGVLSGIPIARMVFREVSPSVKVRSLLPEGAHFEKGSVLATVRGPARAILTAERTALNFLQHMCGVATVTAAYVQAVAGTGAKIFDTRKTLPGLRAIEKYAVVSGGGKNHRVGLFDQVLIKDNHIAAVAEGDPIQAVIAYLVIQARSMAPHLKVEIEVSTPGEAEAALLAGADIIMLDNFTPPTFRKTAEKLRATARRKYLRMPPLEASGGITLKSVSKFALAGADRISVGALTHTAGAVDISLDAD